MFWKKTVYILYKLQDSQKITLGILDRGGVRNFSRTLRKNAKECNEDIHINVIQYANKEFIIKTITKGRIDKYILQEYLLNDIDQL